MPMQDVPGFHDLDKLPLIHAMKSLSIADLATMLRNAQEAHHEAEKVLPPHDWADWYAQFILEQVTLFEAA